ncbi:MAG: DUF3990 domain-containing protein [Bacteroidales bacterium]|jgi:hypothetical protein|nr:DUF3990 domain-containing protein [Bacteroidales bacterium]
MTLYHGSTDIVKVPKIIRGDNFLDFGSGFYTTTSQEQALRWAKIKQKRVNSENAFLNIYEIDEAVFFEKPFSALNFDEPSREWLEFVMDNRRGKMMHSYDFVKGPVANDTLYRTFTLFESGDLTLQETITRLKVHELFDQISFHTENALQQLKFIEINSL